MTELMNVTAERTELPGGKRGPVTKYDVFSISVEAMLQCPGQDATEILTQITKPYQKKHTSLAYLF